VKRHPHRRSPAGPPGTVERARAAFLEAALEDRVTLAGQSFFDPLPAGHDLYLVRKVIND
jgi:hypothetical protein